MRPKRTIEPIDIFFLFLKPFMLIILVTIVGTIGYQVVEDWSFLDSLYMSIISITTVGYETPQPLTENGKIFSSFYLMFAVMFFLYIVGEFTANVVALNFSELFQRKKMESTINTLKNHHILCGYGRTGAAIADELFQEKQPFIIIDNDPDRIQTAQEVGYLAILGQANEDETLQRANIAHARSVFATLREDSDNLFVTISAKDLNPNVKIIIRCLNASNEAKMIRAGATNVITPFTISSSRMVSSVLRPIVADFLDEVTKSNPDLQLRIDQAMVPENSAVCHKSILDSDIRPLSGVYILAIQRENVFIHNPTADTILKPYDTLIVLGTTDQFIKLEETIKKKTA